MRKVFILILICMAVISCKKKEKTVLTPEKASLIFPSKDETCSQGEILSTDLSNITFRWNSAANTESYDLIIKDLITGISSSVSSPEPQLAVKLKRNNPYSWMVVSKSTKTSSTAQSESWKFYNAGAGVLSYAPFPAEIKIPAANGNITAVDGKITLSWSGSDVDNDIASYSVFLGEILPLQTPLAENLTESTLKDVKVVNGKIYLWKIITKDSKGNTSDSGVSQFKVN